MMLMNQCFVDSFTYAKKVAKKCALGIPIGYKVGLQCSHRVTWCYSILNKKGNI